jgi:YHS domain-containing protein
MNLSDHKESFPGHLPGNQPSAPGNRSDLAAYIDAEALAFVDVLVPTRVLETVCHRAISGDPVYYPQAALHGQTIYFCTDTCQSVFLSDPERFYAAHSKRRP